MSLAFEPEKLAGGHLPQTSHTFIYKNIFCESDHRETLLVFTRVHFVSLRKTWRPLATEKTHFYIHKNHIFEPEQTPEAACQRHPVSFLSQKTWRRPPATNPPEAACHRQTYFYLQKVSRLSQKDGRRPPATEKPCSYLHKCYFIARKPLEATYHKEALLVFKHYYF